MAVMLMTGAEIYANREYRFTDEAKRDRQRDWGDECMMGYYYDEFWKD